MFALCLHVYATHHFARGGRGIDNVYSNTVMVMHLLCDFINYCRESFEWVGFSKRRWLFQLRRIT